LRPLILRQLARTLHDLENRSEIAIGEPAHDAKILFARRVAPGDLDEQIVAHNHARRTIETSRHALAPQIQLTSDGQTSTIERTEAAQFPPAFALGRL